MRTRIDISGQTFHWLAVLERIGSKKNCALWRCRCVCGKERLVITERLRSGHTKSCGCKHPRKVHGYSSTGLRRGARSYQPTPTYSSWKSMISRCTQPSNPAFEYYKTTGVKLCERWTKFESFLVDMGERPTLAHTIDRHPDKRGNYEPGNCRWATRREQANNRVTNVLVEYHGTMMTMAELTRFTGLPKELLRHRITRAGWSIEDAVAAPKQQGKRGKGRRQPTAVQPVR